ncbi:hypothetical protein [Maribacter luteus]|uniref:hypothetical protein n=1 Tax=Maribacter luteus TaxID=2594478 RepID=UPI002490C030|nr:hypothetical protein [Maribacter luteus]
MRIPYKKLVLLTIILGLLSFLSVLLFTMPTLWQRLDLTNTSGIGDTIGGITAPVLGIISIVLLYVTLNRQIDSINDQKLKNESDIIFMLLNQLESEYNQIYMSGTTNNEPHRYYGHEALTKYSNSVFKHYSQKDKKWSSYYISDSILLVIRSLKLVERRIELSNLDVELKSMFTDKLQTFYQMKLKDSLYKLSDLFSREPSLQDEYTIELTEFYNRFNK